MNKQHTEKLNKLDAQQLKEKLEGFRRELFQLRLTSSTSAVRDISQFKKLRKNIARALTYLHVKVK